MLVIDDNMLKLAKMQEKLLKISSNNKSNIDKYIQTITKIDDQAYNSLLDELKQINTHNQTLEEEIKYLEDIKSDYTILYELQSGFKNILETNYINEIELSNIENVDIEYINTRIDTISGYLINQKNLEINKKRLEELSNTLVEEEKKNKYLEEKLLEYEKILRENFQNAEGRTIEDGNLQYISVETEYSTIGYDFKYLLENENDLKENLSKIELEQAETLEKLKTAEICYNSMPNSSSKQILNDIELEFLKIRYRLTMLKILQYLITDYSDYDKFKEKRENLLDLIKYRANYLKKLNVHISIDPFERTKINEQLSQISGYKSNSKTISKIKKEIVNLSERIEQMQQKDREYMLEINNKKDKLIINSQLYSDHKQSISPEKTIKFEDLLEIKTVEGNQVIKVRNINNNFNMRIVKDKTNSVIKRVNEMITLEYQKDTTPSQTISSPELFIVESTTPKEIEEIIPTIKIVGEETLDKIKQVPPLEQLEKTDESKTPKEEKRSELSIDTDLFTTVDPFETISLFEDKVEEISDNLIISLEEEKKEEPEELKIELETKIDEMPEAFWITQDDSEKNKDNNEQEPSFDEQIEALLSEDNNKNLVKKLTA